MTNVMIYFNLLTTYTDNEVKTTSMNECCIYNIYIIYEHNYYHCDFIFIIQYHYQVRRSI